MNVPQIYVYCSGKSGSTSLYEALKDTFETIHVHSNIEFLASNPDSSHSSIFDLIADSRRKYRKIYFIDAYRTPVERRISSYFQHTPLEGRSYNNYITAEKQLDAELAFLETYSAIAEVFSHFGLSNFSTFDWDKKYNIKEHQDMVFIKLRFADIRQWGEILTSILGRPISMVQTNLTSEKASASLYDAIKKQYKIPDKVLEYIILTDPEYKVYVHPQEQLNYLEYWHQRSKSAEIPADFNWLLYAALNRCNFIILTELEAIVYYLRYRSWTAYKFTIVPDDFDVDRYLELNEDLSHLNKIEARVHYEICGFLEDRVYK